MPKKKKSQKNKRKIQNGRRKEKEKDLYIYGAPWSYLNHHFHSNETT